ncbi:MAG: hypothetical protein ABFR50_04895 [Candidatus Fermentibacteria bacterium]
MYKVILSLVISGFLAAVYADYATQTDWSGGPGIHGPVINWEDDFDTQIGTCWWISSGSLQQWDGPPSHLIGEGGFDACYGDVEPDLDGDILINCGYSHAYLYFNLFETGAYFWIFLCDPTLRCYRVAARVQKRSARGRVISLC